MGYTVGFFYSYLVFYQFFTQNSSGSKSFLVVKMFEYEHLPFNPIHTNEGKENRCAAKGFRGVLR